MKVRGEVPVDTNQVADNATGDSLSTPKVVYYMLPCIAIDQESLSEGGTEEQPVRPKKNSQNKPE